jgi:hypothetical protein
MATGLAAPFVAWGLARGTRPPAGGGFNVFGLAALIDAATLGVLLGLGLFAVEPTTEILAFLPLALVPTVAVPVAITLHIVAPPAAGRRPRQGSAHVMTIPTGEPTTGARKAITAALACRPASDREHRLR